MRRSRRIQGKEGPGAEQVTRGTRESNRVGDLWEASRADDQMEWMEKIKTDPGEGRTRAETGD